MSGTFKKYLNSGFTYYAAIAIVLVAMVPRLCFGVRDAYVGFSGTVVEKQRSWMPLRGVNRYIILKDSDGHLTKRYVSAYGYVYCDVGSFVVKKKGFGELPRTPGELTPTEVEQLVQRKLQQK